MDNFDKQIAEEVKGFLDKNVKFTSDEGERIQLKAQQGGYKSRKFNPVYWTVLTAAAILFLVLSLPFLNGLTNKEPNNQHAVQGSGNDNHTLPEFEMYKGEALKIGVVGNPPDVREKDLVHFEPLTFNDLIKNNLKNVDAVFIMKEHLEEASESKYTKVYLESKIPFFFIEAAKGTIPFITEHLSYEKSPDIKSGFAVAGYIPNDSEDGLEIGIGLYNHIRNNETFANLYSMIFEEIHKYKLKANVLDND